MAKYKIKFKRSECIGAAECEAISPDLWKVQSDGIASLKGAKEIADGWFELEITQEQFELQEKVAGSCPAGCIKIERCDTD